MKNYISFDIGGTDIKYALLNEEGVFLRKGSYPTPENFEDFKENIFRIINESNSELNGLCFSLPGAVDDSKGTIGGSSALPYIHGPNFREIFQSQTGLEVAMENDANCAALGENWLGSGKGKKDMLFLVIGTGVGGAIIKDSQIHRGINFHGGEFGYMISEIRNGKYETLSGTGSTKALVSRVEDRLGVEESSLNGKIVYEMASDGNQVAIEEIAYFNRKLAEAIYNLQYFFDPEVISLGGSISSRSTLSSEISKELDNIYQQLPFAKIKPVIRNCELMGDANLVGALRNFKLKNKD